MYIQIGYSMKSMPVFQREKTIVCNRAAQLIECDCHAHHVSKAGSVISSKSPSPAFR